MPELWLAKRLGERFTPWVRIVFLVSILELLGAIALPVAWLSWHQSQANDTTLQAQNGATDAEIREIAQGVNAIIVYVNATLRAGSGEAFFQQLTTVCHAAVALERRAGIAVAGDPCALPSPSAGPVSPLPTLRIPGG